MQDPTAVLPMSNVILVPMTVASSGNKFHHGLETLASKTWRFEAFDFHVPKLQKLLIVCQFFFPEILRVGNSCYFSQAFVTQEKSEHFVCFSHCVALEVSKCQERYRTAGLGDYGSPGVFVSLMGLKNSSLSTPRVLPQSAKPFLKSLTPNFQARPYACPAEFQSCPFF